MSVRGFSQCRPSQNGFAVAYIMVSIALIGALAYTMRSLTDDQSERRKVTEVHRTVTQQIDVIRSQILLCRTMFPSGDNGSGFRPQYPGTPVSGLVADLTCPGDPSANKNIWSGRYGTTMPIAPSGLAAWQYANDGTNLRIWTHSASATLYDLSLSRAASTVGPDATWTAGTSQLSVQIAQ